MCAANAVQQRRPLVGDLALEQQVHVAWAFVGLGNLEHCCKALMSGFLVYLQSKTDAKS
jgi:hypothetical protein